MVQLPLALRDQTAYMQDYCCAEQPQALLDWLQEGALGPNPVLLVRQSPKSTGMRLDAVDGAGAVSELGWVTFCTDSVYSRVGVQD